jgi:Aromatic-ring-opening dioxygenase LigAB, LigA subunit
MASFPKASHRKEAIVAEIRRLTPPDKPLVGRAARLYQMKRSQAESGMTDYWVSKLFFDLQEPGAAEAYRADRAAVLARYPLAPAALKAVLADDVAYLARCVNPYLLRYYFACIGMPDAVFIRRLREMRHG